MKTLLIVLAFMMSSLTVFAGKLEVNVIPKNPVLDQPFKVEFVITIDEGSDPVINFKPSSNLEIISRGNSSMSSRTSYINGKMTYERKITLAYDLVASTNGFGFLRNVTAEINGEVIKHPNVRVHILKQAAKPQSIFVRAETDKETYYVGESIVVRYYIYNKSTVPLNSVEIKKFPKLDKFLKRYHVEKNIPNRVTIDGEVFMKRVHYTAQLFATKPGMHDVDPISLQVRYSAGRIDPFGGFGFGRLGDYKTQTIRSPKLELNIIPLPLEGRPENFTGLVGEHNFTMDANKTKFLANEPMEFNLIVEGSGALELFEAPKLILESTVEEFESGADLELKPDFSARKVFDYTYLGRENILIDKYDIPLNYFDPEKKIYVEKNISLGPLEVVGIGSPKPTIKSENTKITDLSKSQNSILDRQGFRERKNTFEPLYKSINSFIYYSKHFVVVIYALCLILLVYLVFIYINRMKNKTYNVFDSIYKRGVTYKSLVKIFSMIDSDEDMKEIIKSSDLTNDSREYFINLIEELNVAYSENKPYKKINIKKKYFKQLEKFIRKNELI